jgi:putative transposase
MQKGYLIRLYPNKAQSDLLGKHFGCCRWVYNHMIEINQKRYHRTGKGMSGYDMQNMLPKLKKQYPWLAEVNSQSLQIVCHNLAEAYNRFFKKVAKYPVFKKKRNGGSFTCINNSRIEGKHIRLPKLGMIRFRGGKPPTGIPKRFTIREKAGKFYASILFDDGMELSPLVEPLVVLGIDLGLQNMITTSQGESCAPPCPLKQMKQNLREAQRSFSRCQITSKRRIRARLRVSRLHEKIANQRKDFSHKLSRALVADSENQAFAVESLNIKGMLFNHNLASAIADCGWRQFLIFLKYKSRAVGKQIFEVDRFFPSSKTCSACGIVRESLSLSCRAWTCKYCGTVHDREINAAINIGQEAVRNIVSERGGGIRPTVRLAATCEA